MCGMQYAAARLNPEEIAERGRRDWTSRLDAAPDFLPHPRRVLLRL
jgi:hypothetical protein